MAETAEPIATAGVAGPDTWPPDVPLAWQGSRRIGLALTGLVLGAVGSGVLLLLAALSDGIGSFSFSAGTDLVVWQLQRGTTVIGTLVTGAVFAFGSVTGIGMIDVAGPGLLAVYAVSIPAALLLAHAIGVRRPWPTVRRRLALLLITTVPAILLLAIEVAVVEDADVLATGQVVLWLASALLVSASRDWFPTAEQRAPD